MFNLPGSAVKQRAGTQAFGITGISVTQRFRGNGLRALRPKTIGDLLHNHDWG
jgi:hypothetical protein